MERHYQPIKMNFEMLGNQLPHLHTHVIPRYLDDGEPGHPAHFMRTDAKGKTEIPEETYTRDVDALRALLGYPEVPVSAAARKARPAASPRRGRGARASASRPGRARPSSSRRRR
ncbi:MAG TPA: HIT domain-containing protein [Candidatus Limnocylindria bacterium]|nr:HIT domain-containing protein [Candidatus Limnocylindria bacterium]